jgi:parallel beta-helix repeat protein
MAITGQRGTLYIAPNNPFYQAAGEHVVTIIDTSGSISQLQADINQARTANPNKLLIIRLYVNQTYNVTTDALTLSSNMIVHGLGATIVADAASTATELIKITNNSTNVSVSNLTLDGKSRVDYCIAGNSINRCNIDALSAYNSNDAGIDLSGSNPLVYDNEITVTRCTTRDCLEGIRITSATQALCMDNVCNAVLFGMSLTSCVDSTVINNQFLNAGTGIAVLGTRCSVANNTFNNHTNAVELQNGSTFCKVVSNSFNNSAYGIYDYSNSNTVYDNDFSNISIEKYFSLSSVTRIITTSTELNAAGQNYFYPPTVTNRHSSVIRNSTSRTNITAPDTSLSNILTAYDDAKAANPSNVIVMNLTAPVITGNLTITLSSNSCFVLSGSIMLDSGVTAFSGKNISYVSFSGGTLSGQHTAGRRGITLESCSFALIDQMTFNDFGDKNTRVTGSEPILLEGCQSPVAVGYCNINGGAARGLWIKGGTQSTNNLIFTNNTISNVNMDGIDIDVTCTGMLATFNNCHDNIRYGIFVEEGAKINQILTNSCSGNEIGFNIFSNVVTGTNNNSFIANKSSFNERGIRFGATSTKNTSGNFAFNNSITSCVKGIDAQNTGSENYCSQNYLYNNTVDISDVSSAVFFNSPFFTLIAARINASGVYQTVNYFDEISYAANKIGYTAVHSAEFNEVALQGVGGGLGKRESDDNKVYVSGYFDEVTPITDIA